MHVADMKAAVSLAVEQAMKLIMAESAPAAPKPAPAKKPVSDEVRAKRLASLEKARAAKKAKGKPAKKAEKPAAESAKKPDDGVVYGAIELVEYTREDGTPGIVLRPKGRKRGVAFAKGDWAVFCTFANTFRKGETIDPICRAVKARIGG